MWLFNFEVFSEFSIIYFIDDFRFKIQMWIVWIVIINWMKRGIWNVDNINVIKAIISTIKFKIVKSPKLSTRNKLSLKRFQNWSVSFGLIETTWLHNGLNSKMDYKFTKKNGLKVQEFVEKNDKTSLITNSKKFKHWK